MICFVCFISTHFWTERKWLNVQMNDDSEPLIVRFRRCCWLYCQHCSASEQCLFSVTQAKIHSHSSNTPQLQCTPLSLCDRTWWMEIGGTFSSSLLQVTGVQNKQGSPWRLTEKLSCTSTLPVWQDSLRTHCFISAARCGCEPRDYVIIHI